MVEHLVMQRRKELGEAHPLLGGDLLQGVPERHFQPDRGAMAIDPQRSGLRFIVALRLVREEMAHGVPPFIIFLNDIPPHAAPQSRVASTRRERKSASST